MTRGVTGFYGRLVKRVVAIAAIGFLSLATFYRIKEAMGALSCDCYADCWCRRPGLSLFRWVFPRFHHNPGLEAWKKRELAARG